MISDPPLRTMHEAAEMGYADDVPFLLGMGKKLDEYDDYGQLPLGVASRHGNTGVVRALIEFGANPDEDDYEGYLPLQYALWNEQYETIFALLEYGTETERERRTTSALHLAACDDDTAFLTLLFDVGVPVDVVDERGATALFNVVRQQGPYFRWFRSHNTISALAAVSLLLEQGADVRVRVEGESVVRGAALRDDREMVRLLCEKGAVLELLDAAMIGDTSTVNHLIDLGENIETRDSDGNTPLHHAARAGKLEAVRLLLERGADISYKNNDDETPLKLAVEEEYLSVVALLLQHEALTTESKSILVDHIAGGWNDDEKCYQIAVLLLKYGVDVNAHGRHGDTALMAAARQDGEKSEELVVLLIADGADVNTVNESGYTALMQSAERGTVGATRLLLEAGADPNLENINFGTALGYATCHGHDEIAALLRESLAVVS